ncbi:hypothetical protein BDZ97DRAFT_1931412 [Flammula alnicola]|nr:hypothetical protein BDZ97DRAFT_1931412 [Flammula alnicola]
MDSVTCHPAGVFPSSQSQTSPRLCPPRSNPPLTTIAPATADRSRPQSCHNTGFSVVLGAPFILEFSPLPNNSNISDDRPTAPRRRFLSHTVILIDLAVVTMFK